MSNSNPVKLALIGLGNQGAEHLKAAQEMDTVDFVAGVDTNNALRNDIQKEYPEMALHPEISDLNNEAIDGLVLALPHHVYSDKWEDISKLQRPILKEKPLGRNYLEALNFLKHSGRLQTAIQRRHHETYKHLKDAIVEYGHPIEEIHAHMHLGFNKSLEVDSWRTNKNQSGGGALLDSGYHMVDLAMFLAGSFETVSATVWRDDEPLMESGIEDRANLIGRSHKTWINIDSRVYTEKKSECVTLKAGRHIWKATREAVFKDGQKVFTADRDWTQAMQLQLKLFAENINSETWASHPEAWDQLPVMQIIDEAYQKAFSH